MCLRKSMQFLGVFFVCGENNGLAFVQKFFSACGSMAITKKKKVYK